MKNGYTRHDIRWRASQAKTEANEPIDVETIRRLLGHAVRDVATRYARPTRGQRAHD